MDWNWASRFGKWINEVTKPRDPEREFGDQSTVDATEAVREKGQPIKILTD